MRARLFVAMALSACTGEVDTDGPDDTDDTDVAVDGCRATPADPDRTRAVVVSRPYDAGGAQANVWEVLDLDAEGALSRTGRTFEMGRGYDGDVAFTPDGSLGIAVQDRGSIGVFTLDDERVPTVVAASFAGDEAAPFYASAVAVDPTGERAYVVDGNWANNGGGIYEIALDCATGAPSSTRKLLSSKLASALFLRGDRAVLVANEVDDVGGGEAWLLAWGSQPEALGPVDLFDYADPLEAGSAVTPDGKYLLVGDYSEFSGEDNRVSVAAIAADGLTKTQEIAPFLDPIALAVSPLGDGALFLSGYGDAIVGFSYDPSAAEPFVETDTIASSLPGAVDVVSGGGAAGIAVVSESAGVRRVRFDGSGGLVDLGRLELGEGMDGIPGSIGVQP